VERGVTSETTCSKSENSPKKTKTRIKWEGHVAHMGEWLVAYRFLVGNPETYSLLGRPRHRWDYNIKRDI
jgi:hypothetical protein